MKVKELIDRLQQEDPEAHIAINGYEGGVSIVGTVSSGILVKDVHTVW